MRYHGRLRRERTSRILKPALQGQLALFLSWLSHKNVFISILITSPTPTSPHQWQACSRPLAAAWINDFFPCIPNKLMIKMQS